MDRALVVASLVLLAGCASDPAPADGVTVAQGWSVEVLRDDLQGPTQVVEAPDGRVLVAQLSGGEDAGVGTVVDLGPDGTAPEPEVLVDGLLTPTGLAVVGDELLVQQPESLLRTEGAAAVPGEDQGVTLTALLEDLPNNGRSQGTLTPLPDGRIAFEVSGTGSGPDPDPMSGRVWAIAPDAAPGTEPELVASGFKGPYAHAPAADGGLWVTEIGDGTYDGAQPPDELTLVPLDGEPGDGGWPLCVGTTPVVDNGGTEESCTSTLAPTALFPERATPTSVVELADGTVLVALWVEGRVVEVDPVSGDVTDVLTGVANPQHLLVRDDGSVLLSVHGSGELWRLTRG